jgi:hypothetical protein
MNDEDSKAREHELREKIAGQLRSIGQARGKPLLGEELQKLKSAASRLERMLKDSANADRETLVRPQDGSISYWTIFAKATTSRLVSNGGDGPHRSKP